MTINEQIQKIYNNKLFLFVPHIHFNRLLKICLSNADILV